MHDHEDPSPEYLRGFNEAYLLSKENPELADKIAGAIGESERSKGFKAGYEEYQKENSKGKLPSWLKEDRLISLNKEKNIDKDKDSIQKE